MFELINVRNAGTTTVSVYRHEVYGNYAIMLVRSNSTQINRTADTEDEALVIQSELWLAEPKVEDKYADNMYDE